MDGWIGGSRDISRGKFGGFCFPYFAGIVFEKILYTERGYLNLYSVLECAAMYMAISLMNIK